jgi:hypothetical protein
MEIKNQSTQDLEELTLNCSLMPADLLNAGRFITPDEATLSLRDYLNEPGTPPADAPGHIYGHTFGLQKLRELMLNIDVYNSQQVSDDTRVQGVRMYYGKSARRDPAFPLSPPGVKVRDVFMMPVLKDGNDLFKLNPVAGDADLILGESRPCPNQCGFTFY